MKSYSEWDRQRHLGENFFRDLGRGVSNFNKAVHGQPTVDYGTIDQQAKASEQARAQRDDPNVKQNKYMAFKKSLFTKFFQLATIKKAPFRARAEQALDNLAKSFTMGYKIHVRDLDELLLAIHTDQDVDEQLKAHTFTDHYRLMMFIQQVFDHDPTVWYNPDARTREDRFPPGAVLNTDEMNSYMDHWQDSPFRHRYKGPEAAAPVTGTGGGAVPPVSNGQEFIDWMLKTFIVGNAKQKGKNIAFPAMQLQAHEWKELADIMARQAGITLTPADYARLKDLA